MNGHPRIAADALNVRPDTDELLEAHYHNDEPGLLDWIEAELQRRAVRFVLAALFVAAVIWAAWQFSPLLAEVFATGPYCPGSDPAWLGWCSDAPMMEGW